MNSIRRKQFIKYLFNCLSKYEYVLLKHIAEKVEEISEFSDLDILISKKNKEQLFFALQEFPGLAQTKFEVQQHVTFARFYFEDGGFLQVDFLHRLIRKNRKYLDHEYVLKNRIKIKGIWTYPTKVLLEHVYLFNQLNQAGLPSRYIKYFNNLEENSQKESLDYLNQKYKLQATCFEDLASHNTQGISKSNFPKQSLFEFFIWTLAYIKDTFCSLVCNSGRVITFSGVDGAGKSTVIEHIVPVLEKKYRRKVKVLRHRPSILPILSVYKHGKKKAAEIALNTGPHQGNNRSRLSSFFRFMYYYLDYLLGQVYLYFRYLLPGYIVVYDRYYFDFIVDGKRSNIKLPQSIVLPLYKFIYKPSLNIFLYAAPATIVARKQELTEEKVGIMTQSYLQLFALLKNVKNERAQYVPIENVHLDQTINQIVHRCAKIV